MGREPKMKEGGGGEGKFPSFLPHSLPALLLPTFFTLSFDTRSLFFGPKRHGNAATQTTGAWVGGDYSLDLKVLPFMVPYLLLVFVECGCHATPLYKLRSLCGHKGYDYLLLLVSHPAPPIYPHTNSPN